MKTLKFKHIVLLLFTFLVYSSTSIFTKLASNQELFSVPYCLYFGMVVFIVFVYAILWQCILKIMPLNLAFMCKAITIVFVLLISRFLFQESISINNVIGCVFIISGIVLFALKS